jgi:hypothetical protein
MKVVPAFSRIKMFWKTWILRLMFAWRNIYTREEFLLFHALFLFAILFLRSVTRLSRYSTCSWLNFQTEIDTKSTYYRLVHTCCYLCLLLIRHRGSHLKIKYENEGQLIQAEFLKSNIPFSLAVLTLVIFTFCTKSLCEGPIPRPEESYWGGVSECDSGISAMRSLRPSRVVKKKKKTFLLLLLVFEMLFVVTIHHILKFVNFTMPTYTLPIPVAARSGA